jgi:FkbM family methyltransferase
MQNVDDAQLAVDYLLMSNLNLLSQVDEGPAGHERLTLLFWDILERLRPAVFCDIGAFDGRIAAAAKQKFPGLSVYSFEANPEIFALHAQNPALADVKYLNVAISDAVGPVKIYAPRILARYYTKGEVLPGRIEEPRCTGKTSLRQRNENAVYEEFEVSATTLDEFFARAALDVGERRFALWIGAEGAADKVLTGAQQLLGNTVAVFIAVENFEFWKQQKDSVYIARELISRGFVPIARDREYGDHQFNVLFVKAALIPHIASELFDAQSPLRSCAISSEQRIASREPANAKHCLSLGAHFQSRIPIIIPVYNSVTYLRMMVSQLRSRGFQEIIVVDNASTFPPLLEYLSHVGSEVTVIRLDENKGPHVFLDRNTLLALPDYFCVSDPDLQFGPSLPDQFLCELISLTEEHRVGKAGLALEISDWSLMREERFQIEGASYQIWDWEAQFWKNPVGHTSTGDAVYDASIDTTFALYNKRFFDPSHHWKALRAGGKYTSRHLPWYKQSIVPQEEEDYYRATQKFSHYRS